MEKKWKAFIMKYRIFCIAAGIVGFLLGPFLWPFFLAIILNTLSLTVPILLVYSLIKQPWKKKGTEDRSEEHTSELQSRFDLVCRLLLEKKKKQIIPYTTST